MTHSNEPFFGEPHKGKTPEGVPQGYEFPFRVNFDQIQWSEPTTSRPSKAVAESLRSPYSVERRAKQTCDLAGQPIELRLTSFETRNSKNVITAVSFEIEVCNSSGQRLEGGITAVTVNIAEPSAEIIISAPLPNHPAHEPVVVTGLYANLVRTLPRLADQINKPITHTEHLNRREPGLEPEPLQALLTAAGYMQGERVVPPLEMIRIFRPDARK